MQHGLPPQWVVFERRNVAGTWRLVTHGDPIGTGVFYHTETTTEVVARLADPAHYLVFAQVLTGEQTTRLEVKNPTGVIVPRRDWVRSTFPQINNLTVVSPGTADPTFTTLTRAFAPFRHAGAFWFMSTNAADEFLRLEIDSGVAIANQPLLVGICKLHNGQSASTQHANILYGTPFTTGGGATCTAIRFFDNVFWSVERDAVRYRVTASAGSTIGTVTFSTDAANVEASNYVFGGVFTHSVIVRISSIEGETLTGDVGLRVNYSGGPFNTTLNYGPTQIAYTFPFAAGIAITSIELNSIAAADRFEFEVLLNVTN